MYYYNQKNYSSVPYDNPNTGKKEDIASSGCGVCSAAMVINNLAGKELYTVSSMAKFSLANKARDNSGTNMITLLNALCKVNKSFSYKGTTSEDELVKHLKNGGMAIANQGTRNNVFSTSGHYVVALRMVGNNIEVYDPSMYAGKYDSYNRPNLIVKKTDRGCIVTKEIMGKATEDKTPAYYLVTYKKPAPAKKNIPSVKKGDTIVLKTRARLYNYDYTKGGRRRICDVTQLDDDSEVVFKKGAKFQVEKVSKKANGDIWVYIAKYKGWIGVYTYSKDESKI